MSIPDAVCIAAIETVLKPLGTSLRHYEARHKIAAVEAMRGVLQAERERAESFCDTFDGPASDSDFVTGQATAAQQIRAAIRGETP